MRRRFGAVLPRALAVARGAAFVLLVTVGSRAGSPRLLHWLSRHVAVFHAAEAHRSPHHFPAVVILAIDLLLIGLAAAASALLMLTETSPRRALARGRFARRCHLAGRGARGRQLLAGAGTGFAASSLIIGILVVAGLDRTTLLPGSLAAHAADLAGLAAVFAVIGFAEEFAFRGYLLRTLADGIGFWPAALLTSALFGIGHLREGDPVAGAISTVLVAVFFCATLRATGTLAFAIGFHAAWDYVQSTIFGVADSSMFLTGALAETVPVSRAAFLTGGAIGPEGSVLAFATIAALLVAALRPVVRHAMDRRRAAPAGGGSR